MRQRMPLRDEAYALLREWIENGALPRGRMTSENRLCERLGMSRTPVRAALQRLELEGFLRIVPKRGILILPASLERVGNALDLAAAMLLFAVEQSRRLRLAPLAEAAKAGRERLARLGDDDPPERFAEAERIAFTAIAAAVRNAELDAALALQLRRLDWDRSALRRWRAPYLRQTRATLDGLLEAAARLAPDAGQRVLDYFHDLKRHWN